jgi:hypothetical protein
MKMADLWVIAPGLDDRPDDKTSANFYQTTQCQNPEFSHLQRMISTGSLLLTLLLFKKITRLPMRNGATSIIQNCGHGLSRSLPNSSFTNDLNTQRCLNDAADKVSWNKQVNKQRSSCNFAFPLLSPLADLILYSLVATIFTIWYT